MTGDRSSGTKVIRVSFRHALDTGEQVFTHIVITSRKGWDSLPESKSPLWQMVMLAGWVLGTAIDVTRKTVPALTPQPLGRVYTPSRN